jgi:hypothetical protein
MNPALILFGIQSVIRLGRVTNDALEQWERDDEAIFPEIKEPYLDREVYVNAFFNQTKYNHYVLGDAAPLAEYWSDSAVKPKKTAIDALFTASVKIKAENDGNTNHTLAPGAVFLVKQWNPGKGPISPWARIILTAGDIAFEYVSADPSILGLGGNGEKLIAAYAKNLSDILPDNGDFGNKENFAERLTNVFLRAGLSTISRNPEWLVSEEHLHELISSSVKPLVEALPDNIMEQLKWREAVDAVMGPAASAALQTVAKHQTAFLGSNFKPDKALGALTQALFLEAAKDGLKDQFVKEGLIGLYKAALNVAAEKPQLFLEGEGPKVDFTRDVFSKFAGVFKHSPPPFDGEVVVALASASLKAVGDNVHRFMNDTDPWGQTAADMVQSLTVKFKGALDTNEKLNSVFSKEQLIELGRILLSRMTGTPRMVLGSGTEAWEGLLTAVAAAMKEDKNLLLKGEDWIQIVETVADEAAANPTRLFQLNPNDPKDILAAKLINVVLKSAGEILKIPELKGKTVLFGKTLKDAIIIVFRETSGNPQDAQKALTQIEELVKELNLFVAQNHNRFGSKDWLRLFRVLLNAMLEGKSFPKLTEESANDILQGGGQ